MKKFILISLALCLILPAIQAQNEEDVLRYSNYAPIGTARSVGLAGANGAVGGDFSTLSNNPAGIALYKKSELTISPALFFGNSESTYLGRNQEDGKNNFALGNVGIVITGTPENRLGSNPVSNFQFGFGINRLKDFNNRMIIDGENFDNSLLNVYTDYAGSQNPESLNAFDTRPAFDTYLIDTVEGAQPFDYVNAYSYLGGFTSAIQRKSIETSGSMNELVLSGGMNIGDKFYFGLTFGFPYMRYQQTSTFKEINQTENPDLRDFTIYDKLETKGSGFNIKLGAIVKPTEFLRLGAAFHTPTWYNDITDKWSSTTSANYNVDVNGTSFSSQSPIGEYKYDIRTPWKVIASAAVIINRMGFISGEYEYIDYTSGRLSPTLDFSEKNDIIKNSFQSSHNFRIGAEAVLGMMQVRGGYAYRMSPFADDLNDASMHTFSGGLGFRAQEFFVDAALAYSVSKQDYYLYTLPEYKAVANNKFKNYNFVVTLGYRFD